MMKKGKSSCQIDKKFSRLPEDMRECLKGMVAFSPDKRLEAKDILRFSLFDEIRSPEQEQEAEASIYMPFEQDDCYDYEEFVDNVPIENFKSAIEEEVFLIRNIPGSLRD